jgi:hypothetical protein
MSIPALTPSRIHIYLSSKEDLVPLASPLKPLPKQIFAISITIRTVPENLSEFICSVQYRKTCFVGFRLAVKDRKVHDTESHGRDLRAILAKFPGWKLRRHCYKISLPAVVVFNTDTKLFNTQDFWRSEI